MNKLNVTVTHDGSDYRVPASDNREASAYYTDDKQDAIDTARVMYRFVSITLKFKNVDEHPA